MRGGSRRFERGSRLSKSFTRGKLIHKLCSFELYGARISSSYANVISDWMPASDRRSRTPFHGPLR